MRLFHGSLEVVESPVILKSKRGLDFGEGFYTTTDFEQAKRWVENRKRNEKVQEGYVSVFDVEDSIWTNSELNILKFESPNEVWIDFIVNNRTNINYHHAFDLVYGAVADDRVYASLTLFESGFIDKYALIKELKSYKLVDQLLFHTDKAIRLLNFKESIKV